MLKAAVQTIILMSILVTGNVSCLSAEVRFCDYTNLGQRVGSICLHWINESTSDVDPIDTELIADGGVVDSIIVKYPKSITLQEVRESVNKTWLVYENKRLRPRQSNSVTKLMAK
jgi:hypothetical protein